MPAHKNNKYAQKGDEPKTDNIHCRSTTSLKARCVAALDKGKSEKLCDFVTVALEKELDLRAYLKQLRKESK